MYIFKRITHIKAFIQNLKEKGLTIGFVPTMGALHEGHLSLIDACKIKDDVCVVSIFINPTQFNEPEDLKKYPVTIERDILCLLQKETGVLFLPDVMEIYPGSKHYDLDFNPGYLGQCLEANCRPGHFQGVAQVVKKLLDIVVPDTLYLGQKDYQQYLILKKLIEFYDMKTEVVLCPIIREPDGLAMSSRNVYLSVKERPVAVKISQTLFYIRNNINKMPPSVLREKALEKLNDEPRLKVEYLDIVDTETLLPLNDQNNSGKKLVCIAVKLGNTRLIDNIIIP